MARLLEMPENMAAEWRAVHRVGVKARLAAGMGEDEIMSVGVSIAIRAARLEGFDESEVEVAASIARRNIAEALAEQWGDVPEGFR